MRRHSVSRLLPRRVKKQIDKSPGPPHPELPRQTDSRTSHGQARADLAQPLIHDKPIDEVAVPVRAGASSYCESDQESPKPGVHTAAEASRLASRATSNRPAKPTGRSDKLYRGPWP